MRPVSPKHALNEQSTEHPTQNICAKEKQNMRGPLTSATEAFAGKPARSCNVTLQTTLPSILSALYVLGRNMSLQGSHFELSNPGGATSNFSLQEEVRKGKC